MSRLVKSTRNSKSTELHSLLESDELAFPENGNSISMVPFSSQSKNSASADSSSKNPNKHVFRAGASKPVNGATHNGFETVETAFENAPLSEIDLDTSPSKQSSSSRLHARNWLDEENHEGDEDETLFDAEWNLSRDRRSRQNQNSSSPSKGDTTDEPQGDWDVAFERVGSDSDSSSDSDDERNSDSPAHRRLFRSSEEDATEDSSDADRHRLLGSRLPIRRAFFSSKLFLRILSLCNLLFFIVLYVILGSSYQVPAIAMHAVLDSWTLPRPNSSSTAPASAATSVLVELAASRHVWAALNPLGLEYTHASWAARPEPYAALFAVALAARAAGALLAELLASGPLLGGLSCLCACLCCRRSRGGRQAGLLLAGAGGGENGSASTSSAGVAAGSTRKRTALSTCALFWSLLLLLALALVMFLLRAFLRAPAWSLLLIGAMFFYGLLFSTFDSNWVQATVFPVSTTSVLDSRRRSKHRVRSDVDVDEEAGLNGREREPDAAPDGESRSQPTAAGGRERTRGRRRHRREWARGRWLLLHSCYLVGLVLAPLLAHLLLRAALPTLPSASASSAPGVSSAAATTATASESISVSGPIAGVRVPRDPRAASGRFARQRRSAGIQNRSESNSTAIREPTKSNSSGAKNAATFDVQNSSQPQQTIILQPSSPNVSLAAPALALVTTIPPAPAALTSTPPPQPTPPPPPPPPPPKKPSGIDDSRPGISSDKKASEGDNLKGTVKKDDQLHENAEHLTAPVPPPPTLHLPVNPPITTPEPISKVSPLDNSNTLSDFHNGSDNSTVFLLSLTPTSTAIPTTPTIPTITTSPFSATTLSTTTESATTTTTVLTTTIKVTTSPPPSTSTLSSTTTALILPNATTAFRRRESTTERAAKELLRSVTTLSGLTSISASAPFLNNATALGKTLDYMSVFQRVLAEESRHELALFSLHALLLLGAALVFLCLCALPLLATCCCKSRVSGLTTRSASGLAASAFRALGAYRALFESRFRAPHGATRLEQVRLAGSAAMCSPAAIGSLLVSLVLAVYLVLEALFLFFFPLLEFRARSRSLHLTLASDTFLGQYPSVMVSVFWVTFLIARVGSAALLQSEVPQERCCRRFSQSCLTRFLFCETLNLLRRPLVLFILLLLLPLLLAFSTFGLATSLDFTPGANAFGLAVSSFSASFRLRLAKLDSHNVLMLFGALSGACLGLFVPLVSQLLCSSESSRSCSLCCASSGRCSHAILVQLASVLCCVFVGANVELRGVYVVAVAALGLSLLLALLTLLALVCVRCCCSSSSSSSAASSPSSSARGRRSADEAEALSLTDYLCLCCFCFSREFRVRHRPRARSANGGTGNHYRSLNAKSRTN